MWVSAVINVLVMSDSEFGFLHKSIEIDKTVAGFSWIMIIINFNLLFTKRTYKQQRFIIQNTSIYICTNAMQLGAVRPLFSLVLANKCKGKKCHPKKQSEFTFVSSQISVVCQTNTYNNNNNNKHGTLITSICSEQKKNRTNVNFCREIITILQQINVVQFSV